MKAVAQTCNEGGCACVEQANILDTLINFKPSANEWSSIQNNNNNEYYLSLADGSYNNNNKNNNYWVVPVESKWVCDLVFNAEADCWSNKHSSWDANKYHYHTGRRIWEFIKSLTYRNYRPWKSYCFVVMYPKPREIFAAHYQDRIAHHIAAPYMIAVAEAVHNKNGNVSFGNRKGVSSYHACRRVQQVMQKHPNGYIVTIDLQGYFMSIDRNVAWRIFSEYEKEHTPQGYSAEAREFMLWLIELLIKNDPSENCERRSPDRLWHEHIKPHKSLFGNSGRGLPIGNYYSQIIANLLPERICDAMAQYDITEFVDDFAYSVDTREEIKQAEQVADKVIAELHLSRNVRKRYVQPVRHGVLWCGHMIHANRIYTSNRTIRNCERKIQNAIAHPTLNRARRLQQTINSYFGMMAHDNEYKTQKRIAAMVENSAFAQWLYFDNANGHFVCRMRREYKRLTISAKDIFELQNYYRNSNMIVIPVKKGSKHFERKVNGFIYRYGYKAIAGQDDYISAAVEETRTRLKEADIRHRVAEYCAAVGIPNEYDPADYGY